MGLTLCVCGLTWGLLQRAFCCTLLLVRDFYRQRSAGLESEEPAREDETRPSVAAAATRSAVSHRDATWRAGFALRVYEVMVRQPADYAVVRRQQGTAVGLAYGTLFGIAQLSHLALHCGNSHTLRCS